MHLLWMWVLAASEALAVAMALARNSVVVQRTVTLIEANADYIAQRASALYNEAVVFAESRGYVIIRDRIWTFVRAAMDEGWPEIEAQLVRNNVSSEMIASLRAQLLDTITVRVLGGASPPSWSYDVLKGPWPWIWKSTEPAYDCSSLVERSFAVRTGYLERTITKSAAHAMLRSLEAEATLAMATGSCTTDLFKSEVEKLRDTLDAMQPRGDGVPIPVIVGGLTLVGLVLYLVASE